MRLPRQANRKIIFFQQIVLGQLDIYTEKKEAGPFIIQKIKLNWIIDLHTGNKTTKFLEVNIVLNFHDFESGETFLDMI